VSQSLAKKYKLTDGHGIYDLIKPSGSKRWYLDYRYGGKESRAALSVYPLIWLKHAKNKMKSAPFLPLALAVM